MIGALRSVIAGGTIKSLNNILGGGRGREYAVSVLAEIDKSKGTKNDLTKCASPASLPAMRNAAAMRLSIDARQHVHMIARHSKD
ncbi:hypothetical protein [Mesorhizobium sp. LSHC412B00]|uniref:hypothetical protein n=1 Tax=Mesorhizobium sp. LSHC412B00 TaxID=1287285 RepID=UPI0003CF6BC5|nr:hypothetical protein [Mesorhizobium sp. LSHC412B00]ESX91374.1 hypothetical protein X756_04415 [Mesorhizobium sp. LSHC412B00]